MELNLNLTDEDYKAIAINRSYRYCKKRRGFWLILGLNIVALILIVWPIGEVDFKIVPAGAWFLFASGVFLIWLNICRLVTNTQREKIYKAILAKWGIKERKGRKWASE